MKYLNRLALALACCLCAAATAVEVDFYGNSIVPVEEEQAKIDAVAPEQLNTGCYGFFYKDHEGNLKALPIPQALAELLTHLLYSRFDPAGLIFNENGIFFNDSQGNLNPLPLPEEFLKILALLWKPAQSQTAGLGLIEQGIFYLDHEANLKPLPQKLSQLLGFLMSHTAVAPQTRYFCDVLSFSILGTKFNHSACAMHCRLNYYRGGYCNNIGECICRVMR